MKESNILEREVLDVIGENYHLIFSAERKVADVILRDPQKAVDFNVSNLAKESGVSDATVVRLCHHLGYAGYYQFRIALARDLGRKQYEDSPRMDKHDEIDQLFHEYAENIRNIGKGLDIQTMAACVYLLRSCKRVHILAVGNTCHLAEYTGFRLGRLGIRSTFHTAAEYFMNHVNLAEEGDILLAISQSGTSKQVLKGVELGKEKGLKVIAVTAYEGSPIAELADYVLYSAGKEENFNYYKRYAHLNEVAVLDGLLSFVMNHELIESRQADRPEMILSESKV
ncbi:MurR/RpiR family transcriptional regulator [Suipraeoptans intestinalis]|uniref:MurR/RpiR family transcriptional regulator n=1 Tax=Suipraeoptans intestinalis TaxID=2606628 RepID=A0A6N7V0N5_9FIRM|nr:MurR/RpiR family transcriptional regulator [Suipraeoptans intestinalis]MDY3121947.1 MurR/RpiR family transcriptional regulator [Suipraeoptans intestinalis]MSR94165.1 MurR/RpiR family transcriptional regulator [Suipraeoptans intestinalis]